MNLKKRLLPLLMTVTIIGTAFPFSIVNAAQKTPIRGFMIGNSLTASISPKRMEELFDTQYYDLSISGHIGAGVTLGEHVGLQSVTDPDTFYPWKRRNVNTHEVQPAPMGVGHTLSLPGLAEDVSSYFSEAFKTTAFDFVTLQPYSYFVETPKGSAGGTLENGNLDLTNFSNDHKVTINNTSDPTYNGEYYEYSYVGDRQAIDTIMDFALKQKAENGTGSDNFLIYGTWPNLNGINQRAEDTDGNGICTMSEFYNAPYDESVYGGMYYDKAQRTVQSKEQLDLLVKGVKEDHPNLPNSAIKVVPAGEIFAALDKKIIDGTLPGFENYMTRNADYYLGARTNPSMDNGGVPQPLKENAFVQDYGMINLYTDNIHLAAYPHSSAEDGTLASYITAVTMYSVITGHSPLDLPTETKSWVDTGRYTRIDPVEDANLIKAVQQTINDVLVNNPNTGITASATAKRTPTKIMQNIFSTRETNKGSANETVLDDSIISKVADGTCTALNTVSKNNEMLTWKTIELPSNQTFTDTAMGINKGWEPEWNGFVKLNSIGKGHYLALDVTDKLKPGNEYDFYFSGKSAVANGDMAKLCMKITKKDGSVYKETLGLGSIVTSGYGVCTPIKGTYQMTDDVAKAEVFFDIVSSADTDTSLNVAYYFDNFVCYELEGTSGPLSNPVVQIPINVINNIFTSTYVTDAQGTLADNTSTVLTVSNLADTTGAKSIWVTKDINGDPKYSHFGISTMGYIKSNWLYPGTYLMMDATNNLSVGSTYKLTFNLQSTVTAAEVVNVCALITKADGTKEVKILGTTPIGTAYVDAIGTYTHDKANKNVQFFVYTAKSSAPTTAIQNSYRLKTFNAVLTESKTLPIILTSKDNANIAFDIYNPNSIGITGKLLIATYADDEMQVLKTQDISILSDETKPIVTDIPKTDDYMVTIVNSLSSLRPLSSAIRVHNN